MTPPLRHQQDRRYLCAAAWAICAMAALGDLAPATGDDLVVRHDAVLTANVAGDLIVTDGAVVVAQRIDVAGDVIVQNGAHLYAQGVWIAGRLRAKGAGDVTLRKFNLRRSRVFGDIDVRDSTGVIRLFDVRADRHLSIADNLSRDIVVRNSFVLGDLQLFNNWVERFTVVDYTVVAGNIQASGNVPQPVARFNQVFGPPPLGPLLELRVAGAAGDERFGLELAGVRVREWTATSEMESYRFLATEPVAADQIRVAFLNGGDGTGDPSSLVRRLQIDYVRLADEVLQTESPAVYSTGTWIEGDGLLPGYHRSEFLDAIGYFQFGWPGLGNSVLVYNLNQILPALWNYQFLDDGTDLFLDVRGTAGEPQLEIRFGSAGILAEIHDTRRDRSLLAPSFQGEGTDRVTQWTLWELGQRVVHPIPELPWYEHRLNMTQAGNYLGEWNGTVEVELDPSQGQLDVWASIERQWRPELEPFIESSVSALTRYNALAGGSLLVQHVVRLNETRLHGELVEIEFPHFEYWNPFSDVAFDSLGFAFDDQGNPAHWYADSYNLPEFPHWPVADLRGWAVVFDRAHLRTRPAIGLIFGRDTGEVILADGTRVELPEFVFNSMDFDGGMALMPALQPGTLPAGTIIVQYYLLHWLPSIDESTNARLDALAARLPAPRVYFPTAPLEAQLAPLAARLADLPLEPRHFTDHLSTID